MTPSRLSSTPKLASNLRQTLTLNLACVEALDLTFKAMVATYDDEGTCMAPYPPLELQVSIGSDRTH